VPVLVSVGFGLGCYPVQYDAWLVSLEPASILRFAVACGIVRGCARTSKLIKRALL